LSLSSARTCGTVRYVSARPRRGESERSGPASRTRFLQRGADDMLVLGKELFVDSISDWINFGDATTCGSISKSTTTSVQVL
jgi:hypothetical protein